MSLAKNSIQKIAETKAKNFSEEQHYFYNKHNQCCLCSHQLTVDVEVKPESTLINEKVHCSQCKVTVSTSEHPLN